MLMFFSGNSYGQIKIESRQKKGNSLIYVAKSKQKAYRITLTQNPNKGVSFIIRSKGQKLANGCVCQSGFYANFEQAFTKADLGSLGIVMVSVIYNYKKAKLTPLLDFEHPLLGPGYAEAVCIRNCRERFGMWKAILGKRDSQNKVLAKSSGGGGDPGHCCIEPPEGEYARLVAYPEFKSLGQCIRECLSKY